MDNYGFVCEPKRSSRYPEKRLSDLDYADDICLLENSIEKAQQQLDELAINAIKVGLEVNIKKTEYMTNIKNDTKLKLNDNDLQQVEDFKYLGAHLESSEKDMEIRIGQAWSAFWKLEKIWLNKHLPDKIKLNLFQAACISILLYGSETWLITEKMKNRLNAYTNKCYRIMLGIRYEDHIKNEEIYKRLNVDKLYKTIVKRQLEWVGHMCRRSEDEPLRKFGFYQPTHGKSNPGRQPPDYLFYVLNFLNNGSHDKKYFNANGCC